MTTTQLLQNCFEHNLKDISAIYQTGSALIPQLIGEHDDDYVIIVNTPESKAVVAQYLDLYDVDRNIIHSHHNGCNADIFIRTIDDIKTRLETKKPIWWYEYCIMAKMTPLFGEPVLNDCDFMQQFSQYKETICALMARLSWYHNNFPDRIYKAYYYIFVNLYIFIYNTFDFSPKFIALLNRVKSAPITETDLTLLTDWMTMLSNE